MEAAITYVNTLDMPTPSAGGAEPGNDVTNSTAATATLRSRHEEQEKGRKEERESVIEFGERKPRHVAKQVLRVATRLLPSSPAFLLLFRP
jgi:hypothetical protein